MKPYRLTIQERLDAAEKRIRNPSFQQNKGLSNEVSYYVFDYDAKDELIIREWIHEWVSRSNPGIDGFRRVAYDLYDIVIDILEKEEALEQCYSFEKNRGIERVVTVVGRILKLSDDSGGVIVDHIINNTPHNAIVFLSGVGKCFPILRSHKVFNNLHQVFDAVPVVLFYPGKYDGQKLALFDNIKDGNYYRAFPLL